MDAPTIAALASLAVALFAFIGPAAPFYLRLGRLEAEVKAVRECADDQHAQAREHTDILFAQSRAHADVQHAETMSEIRRLTDAFLSHSHAPYGGIVFRIPPPEGFTSTK